MYLNIDILQIHALLDLGPWVLFKKQSNFQLLLFMYVWHIPNYSHPRNQTHPIHQRLRGESLMPKLEGYKHLKSGPINSRIADQWKNAQPSGYSVSVSVSHGYGFAEATTYGHIHVGTMLPRFRIPWSNLRYA